MNKFYRHTVPFNAPEMLAIATLAHFALEDHEITLALKEKLPQVEELKQRLATFVANGERREAQKAQSSDNTGT